MVVEFEANLNHLRTREGMAKARRQGKLRGKQPKLPPSAARTIGAATPKGRCLSPILPRNTALDASPSTASSTDPNREANSQAF
jgi:hypothetical protein